MRWEGRRESKHVEDRRGMSPAGRTMVGGGLGLILVLAFALFTGADPLRLIQDLGMDQQVSAPRPQQGTVAPDDNIRKFVATVLADTEDVWTEAFAKSGRK